MKTIGCFKVGTMNEFMELGKIQREKDGIINFGKWHVSNNGDMEYDNGRYFIEGTRLTETDWIYHLLTSKSWIDWNEFIPAYFQALKNINKEFVKIRIFYKK